MQLKEVRKAAKVKIQDIKLDPRTIKKIETGDETVSVQSLAVYLRAVGLTLTYSL